MLSQVEGAEEEEEEALELPAMQKTQSLSTGVYPHHRTS
jgi:hypothetical protein